MEAKAFLGFLIFLSFLGLIQTLHTIYRNRKKSKKEIYLLDLEIEVEQKHLKLLSGKTQPLADIESFERDVKLMVGNDIVVVYKSLENKRITIATTINNAYKEITAKGTSWQEAYENIMNKLSLEYGKNSLEQSQEKI